MASDKNYVSFWFWFFALILAAIPCIGTVFAITLALVGANETRKNYFKAVLAWQLLLILVLAVFHALGFGVALYDSLRQQVWPIPSGTK